MLFSSVTGIMNGANMSGELINPSVAIPRGTLSALVFAFCTYFLFITATAASSSRQLLINYNNYLGEVNLWEPFVLVGSFFATFSASAGNLIGASRYLEALGDDKIFWNFFNFASVRYKGNPVVAVLTTWLCVQLVSFVESLNEIARVATVGFLMMYAGTSLACAALDIASASNFRPSFRYFSWVTCMMGVVGCIAVAFVVQSAYSGVAISFMVLLCFILHFRQYPSHWGSISQALIYHQVRKYMLMLDPRLQHVKYWRPQMLLMVANPRSSATLMQFVNDMKKGGLYVIGHVVRGDMDDYTSDPCTQTVEWDYLKDFLRVKAFTEITMTDNVRHGLQHLIRLSGLGGMKPNTIVFGFYDQTPPNDQIAKKMVHRYAENRYFVDEEEDVEMDAESPATFRRRVWELCKWPFKTHDAAVMRANDENPFECYRRLRNRRRGNVTAALYTNISESPNYGSALKEAAKQLRFPALRCTTPSDSAETKLPDVAATSRMSSTNHYHSIPQRRIDAEDYVAMLVDTLKMNKNLVVCRHFHDYEKRDMFRHGRTVTIDVWPTNPFKLNPRAASDVLDTSFLFLLQLACVLHQVRGDWRKRSQVRVFVLNLPDEAVKDVEKLLKELRITAKVLSVSFKQDTPSINHPSPDAEGNGTMDNEEDDDLDDIDPVFGEAGIRPSRISGGINLDRFFPVLPDDNMRGLNGFIKQHSDGAGIIFCQLPAPPAETHLRTRYLEQLDMLTKDFPPTVLVHGLHSVTTEAF